MSSFCNGPQIHPLSMFLNLFDQILALEGHFCLDELTNEFLNRNAKIPTAHVQRFTHVLLGQFPHWLPRLPSVHVGQHPCFVAGPRADCGHRTVVGQLCFWHTRLPFWNGRIYTMMRNSSCSAGQRKNQESITTGENGQIRFSHRRYSQLLFYAMALLSLSNE